MNARPGIGIAGVCLAAFWLLFGASAMADPVRGQEPQAAFYRAAEKYEAERYDQAIAEYASLLDQGVESGPFYYNLGNCFFKKGEAGRALLFYERARRLIPRDGDLEANIRYTRSLLRKDAAAEAATWPNRLADKIGAQFTANEIVWLLAIISWVLLAGLFLSRFVRGSKKYVLPVMILGGVLTIAGGTGLYFKLTEIDRTAMIIREEVEARLGPFERAAAHFVLHEGTKVRILERKEGWVKVSRADKKAGWVKAQDIEKI